MAASMTVTIRSCRSSYLSVCCKSQLAELAALPHVIVDGIALVPSGALQEGAVLAGDASWLRPLAQQLRSLDLLVPWGPCCNAVGCLTALRQLRVSGTEMALDDLRHLQPCRLLTSLVVARMLLPPAAPPAAALEPLVLRPLLRLDCGSPASGSSLPVGELFPALTRLAALMPPAGGAGGGGPGEEGGAGRRGGFLAGATCLQELVLRGHGAAGAAPMPALASLTRLRRLTLHAWQGQAAHAPWAASPGPLGAMHAVVAALQGLTRLAFVGFCGGSTLGLCPPPAGGGAADATAGTGALCCTLPSLRELVLEGCSRCGGMLLEVARFVALRHHALCVSPAGVEGAGRRAAGECSGGSGRDEPSCRSVEAPAVECTGGDGNGFPGADEALDGTFATISNGSRCRCSTGTEPGPALQCRCGRSKLALRLKSCGSPDMAAELQRALAACGGRVGEVSVHGCEGVPMMCIPVLRQCAQEVDWVE